MKVRVLHSLLLACLLGASASVFAADSTPPKKTTASEDQSATSSKVRYKKRSQVDFSSQTIEGKMRRPETSLVTASESVVDQGILRLRENFMDKIAVTSGEEVK